MVKLIIGPMGSGKTKKILSFVNERRHSGQKVICMKPEIDTRDEDIKSRDGSRSKAIKINTTSDIIWKISDFMNEGITNFVIDELQFVKISDIRDLETIAAMADANNLEIVVAGLNQTSEGIPFETVAKFAMFCKSITVIAGDCVYCKGPSRTTRCKVKKDTEILVGDEQYEQVCYACKKVLK